MIYKLINKIILCFLLLLLCNVLSAQNNFTQKDREMLMDLKVQVAEVKVQISETNKRLDQFISAVDKRFEQVDNRFDDVNNRFDDVNRRFEEFMIYLGILVAAFTSMTVMTIGFALWDRKTMLKPVENEIQTLKKSVEEIDVTKLEKMLNALRELGKADIKVAQVLKQFNLL